MKVILSPLAEKGLRKIHSVDQIIILRKLKSLEAVLEPAGVKKLTGYSLLSLRVGHYRIVYERTKIRVYVVAIAHRGKVYSLLKQLL